MLSPVTSGQPDTLAHRVPRARPSPPNGRATGAAVVVASDTVLDPAPTACLDATCTARSFASPLDTTVGNGLANPLANSLTGALARPHWHHAAAPPGARHARRTLRVLVVDDHALCRAGLRDLLQRTADVTLLGEACTEADALAAVERLAPDVLVLGLARTPAALADVVRRLAARAPRLPLLVLGASGDAVPLLPLLEAGARGVLTRDVAEDELLAALRTVADGEVWVRPDAARSLGERQPDALDAARAEARAAFATLSERERTVVRLTAEGYGGAEIGRALGISNKTVDTYKQRVEEKLGLQHRTEYVRFALRLGLLAP